MSLRCGLFPTHQGIGSTDDFDSVYAALEGAYGAFVNTDSFTIGEAKEIYTGMRIFELTKQIGTLKHYVWSGLDYSFKVRLDYATTVLSY